MRRVLSALVLAAALAVALSASAGAAGSAENEPAPSTSSESGAVPEEPCPIDENGNCLSDRDRDGVSDTMDNCPDHWNPGQEDNDGDGFGNPCDPTPDGDPPPPPPPPPPPDRDGDGVPDASDNCPDHYNPGQENTFGDGRGDACETPPDDYFAQDAEEEYAEWVSPKEVWSVSGNNDPVTIRESTTASDLASYTTCRRHIYRRRHGRFLWRRGFDQDVYWCWRGGAIVHWQARSTPYEGGACSAEREPHVIRYGGGRGWSGVDVKTEVRFSCNWAPSYPLRDTVWLIGRYLAGGGTEFSKGRYA